MTDRPIIFSAPMVRAVLAGRKTHTPTTSPFQHPQAVLPIGNVLGVDVHHKDPVYYSAKAIAPFSAANLQDDCAAVALSVPEVDERTVKIGARGGIFLESFATDRACDCPAWNVEVQLKRSKIHA